VCSVTLADPLRQACAPAGPRCAGNAGTSSAEVPALPKVSSPDRFFTHRHRKDTFNKQERADIIAFLRSL